MRYAGCLWNRSRLDAYADGELRAGSVRAVEGHLRECAPCRARVEDTRALATRVLEGDLAAPEPDWQRFCPGVESRIRAGAATPVRDPWWLPFWMPVWGHPRVAALATAGLLMALGAGLWPGTEPEALAGQVVVQDVATARPDSSVMVYSGHQEPTVIWLLAQD